MRQDVFAIPSISIDEVLLEVTDDFTYLEFPITNNLSLDIETEKMHRQSRNNVKQNEQESMGQLSADKHVSLVY